MNVQINLLFMRSNLRTNVYSNHKKLTNEIYVTLATKQIFLIFTDNRLYYKQILYLLETNYFPCII